MIAAIDARKSTDQDGVAENQKVFTASMSTAARSDSTSSASLI